MLPSSHKNALVMAIKPASAPASDSSGALPEDGGDGPGLLKSCYEAMSSGDFDKADEHMESYVRNLNAKLEDEDGSAS